MAAGVMAEVTFDGTVNSGAGAEWESAKFVAYQDNYTGYGDQKLTPGGFGGSELDELYVRTDGTYLYVGLTGNLEQNGNAITLLIQTATAGQNVLATEIAPRTEDLPCASNGPPVAVQGLGQALVTDNNGTPDDATDDVTSRDTASTGTTLDTGFAPSYAISINTVDAQVHVSQYSLSSTSLGTWDDPNTGFGSCVSNPASPASTEALPYYATRIYRGMGNVNSNSGVLGGGTNPNGSLYAFNNTGKLGVTGESSTPPPAAGSGTTGDPRTQTTGLEAKIHLADLGYTTPVTSPLGIKVAALLTSGDGYVSNQTLPPIGGGTSLANLGSRPNFTTVAGNQFATVSRSSASFSPTVDGKNIVTEFGVANVVASQDTVTSFGDRDCLTPTAGSELDELYMRTDGNYLYVAVTGNLETNGNAQVLLLDVQSGGQNTLKTEIAPVVSELPCSGNGPPAAVQGLGQALLHDDNSTPADSTDDTTSRDPASNGTVLDSGFEPDYAFAADASGGTLYVSEYKLFSGSQGTWDDPGTGQPSCASPNEALDYFATRLYLGSIGVGSTSTGPSSLSGGTNINGSEFAFNNSGSSGVTGDTVATAGSGSTGDPRTQTRGFEAKISLLDLGFTSAQLPVSTLDVKAMVILTSSDGTVSNQTLPGIAQGTSTSSLGSRPSFVSVPGTQYASATITAASFSPTIDGKDLISKYGVANVLASQDTVTGFGDVTLVPVTDCDQAYSAGSEIDGLWAQDTQGSVPALEVALTGNLEGNGNNLVIFLDTIASAGESTLDANAGRITSMTGVTLPMAADYAVVANVWQGTAYVDLVNLISNTTTYIGSAPAGGLLSSNGWVLAINNTNILGVNSTSTDDPQTANAATATTGVEMSIPLSAIGSPTTGDDVCVFAIITNNGASWLSNQVLPAGLGGGKANYDNTVPNFATLGYTCGSVTLGPVGPECNNPRFDINGDKFVDMVDFAAFQRCWTGSLPAGSVTSECECFDWNFAESDGKIDIEDLAVFIACSNGPGVPANPACDDIE
jgi:hypothetical protein